VGTDTSGAREHHLLSCFHVTALLATGGLTERQSCCLMTMFARSFRFHRSLAIRSACSFVTLGTQVKTGLDHFQKYEQAYGLVAGVVFGVAGASFSNSKQILRELNL